jgi:uncharacterized protein with FMN-binding domain
MRRPVLAVMTGLTAVVVGLGIRAGVSPGGAVAAASGPTGVVADASPSTSAETTTTQPNPTDTTSEGTTGVTVTPSPSATATTRSGTVKGEATSTRWGPVQVQITVKGGEITAVDAIVYPTADRRDQEINSYAIPQLDEAALQAQSAQIDTVSGATDTSHGYIGSLQSAIDQAHDVGLI